MFSLFRSCVRNVVRNGLRDRLVDRVVDSNCEPYSNGDRDCYGLVDWYLHG